MPQGSSAVRPTNGLYLYLYMRMVSFTLRPCYTWERTPAHIKLKDSIFSAPQANVFTTIFMYTYNVFFAITLVAHCGPDMQPSYF